MKLTARGIKALTRPGRYPDADTPTLYLLVKPSGARSWVQRLVIHGTRRDMGLGSTEWRTLAEARELARANRRIARQGGDPRRVTVMTFGQAAAKALEANRAKWRNGKTAAAWVASLDRYAGAIKDQPIDQIGREDVLRILSPIWAVKPEEARKLRTRIRAVFAWAMASGLVDQNPAGEVVGAALPSTKATLTKHYPGAAAVGG